MLDTATETGVRADRRLREEEIIWMTTVSPEGRPQSVPVWFLWDGQTFLIYSMPGRPKLRNIRNNPQVALNLNSNPQGDDVVRVEGEAAIDEDAPPATDICGYIEKYQAAIARIGYDADSFARSYSYRMIVKAHALSNALGPPVEAGERAYYPLLELQ